MPAHRPLWPYRLCPHVVVVLGLSVGRMCFDDTWGYAWRPLMPDGSKVRFQTKRDTRVYVVGGWLRLRFRDTSAHQTCLCKQTRPWTWHQGQLKKRAGILVSRILTLSFCLTFSTSRFAGGFRHSEDYPRRRRPKKQGIQNYRNKSCGEFDRLQKIQKNTTTQHRNNTNSVNCTGNEIFAKKMFFFAFDQIRYRK